MLQNLTTDEMIALNFVLSFIDVKTLLTNAMDNLARQTDTKAKDNANVCFEAIHVFLNK